VADPSTRWRLVLISKAKDSHLAGTVFRKEYTVNYHLLVHSPLGNLSRRMCHINGVYTLRHKGLTAMTDNLFEALLKPGWSMEISTCCNWCATYTGTPWMRALRIGPIVTGERPPRPFVHSKEEWGWFYKDFFSLFSQKLAQTPGRYFNAISASTRRP
jgi:hypothetical protein